uniref:Uncharacterized protein n=1 Tax=Oryza punctata TaxID=4537 RepID=A0A0E0LTK1_ORYPU
MENFQAREQLEELTLDSDKMQDIALLWCLQSLPHFVLRAHKTTLSYNLNDESTIGGEAGDYIANGDRNIKIKKNDCQAMPKNMGATPSVAPRCFWR